MKRLKLLVLGTGITDDTTKLVRKSLRHFANQTGQGNPSERDGKADTDQVGKDAEEIQTTLVFEDVIASTQSQELRARGEQYGYILVLGGEAVGKLENSQSRDCIECHTLKPEEWGGPLRERVIKQLERFMTAWRNYETERKLAELQKNSKQTVEWVEQNIEQFRRYIQLMIQNGRYHAVVFENKTGIKAQVILQDATRRLQTPLEDLIPVVADLSQESKETVESRVGELGYKQVYVMDVEEFMVHIKLICMSKIGKCAYIKVEPQHASDNPVTS